MNPKSINMASALVLILYFFLAGYTANGQVLTTAEVHRIGSTIDSTLYNGDPGYLSNLFNDSMFYNDVVIDTDGNERLRVFNKEFVSQDIGWILGKRIIQMIKAGASYDYLDYWQDDEDNFYLLFRLFDDGSLNYHQYFLTQDIDGQYVIQDLFIYIAGQYFSDVMRNIYLPMSAALIDSGGQESYQSQAAAILKLADISKLIAQDKKREARAIFDNELTDEAKNSSLGRLYFLQLIDIDKEPEAYAKLLEDMTESEDKNIAFYLIGIDKFYLAGKYREALSCIDTVYAYTQDDFLNLYRGNLYLEIDSLELAEASYLNMIYNFPQYVSSYDALLYCQLKRNAPERAIATIEHLFNTNDMNLSIYDSVLTTQYPEFTNSHIYADWLSRETSKVKTEEITHSAPIKAYPIFTTWQEEQNEKFRDPAKTPLSPAQMTEFEYLEFFPYDSTFQIEATFELLKDGRIFEMPTTTDRRPLYKEYGMAYFNINGIDAQLKIYRGVEDEATQQFSDHLFLPYYDATSGTSTYGGGRYIILDIPQGDTIVIDFNESFNPYCAYSKSWSCPITPYENNLQNIAIKAGTKAFDKDGH